LINVLIYLNFPDMMNTSKKIDL